MDPERGVWPSFMARRAPRYYPRGAEMDRGATEVFIEDEPMERLTAVDKPLNEISFPDKLKHFHELTPEEHRLAAMGRESESWARETWQALAWVATFRSLYPGIEYPGKEPENPCLDPLNPECLCQYCEAVTEAENEPTAEEWAEMVEGQLRLQREVEAAGK